MNSLAFQISEVFPFLVFLFLWVANRILLNLFRNIFLFITNHRILVLLTEIVSLVCLNFINLLLVFFPAWVYSITPLASETGYWRIQISSSQRWTIGLIDSKVCLTLVLLLIWVTLHFKLLSVILYDYINSVFKCSYGSCFFINLWFNKRDKGLDWGIKVWTLRLDNHITHDRESVVLIDLKLIHYNRFVLPEVVYFFLDLIPHIVHCISFFHQ